MEYEIDRKYLKYKGYLIPLNQVNGITWNKYSEEWLVNFEYKKDTTRYLGSYKMLEKAAKVYVDFVKKHKTAKVQMYSIQGKLF